MLLPKRTKFFEKFLNVERGTTNLSHSLSPLKKYNRRRFLRLIFTFRKSKQPKTSVFKVQTSETFYNIEAMYFSTHFLNFLPLQHSENENSTQKPRFLRLSNERGHLTNALVLSSFKQFIKILYGGNHNFKSD